MLKRSKIGQSTAEYAIVIGLVIAAVIAMQVYIKRGVQAKFRDASDARVSVTGGGADYGVNDYVQYEPQYSTMTDMKSERDSTEKTTVSIGGGVQRDIVGVEKSSRTGTQEVAAAPAP